MHSVAELAAAPPPRVAMAADGTPVRPLLVVDADTAAGLPGAVLTRAAAALRAARCGTVAVAGLRPVPPVLADAVDLTLSAVPDADRRVVEVDDPLAAAALLAERAAAVPRATLTLAWLLRATGELPVPAALSAESAAYSTLQAGPEFARWLAARRPPRPPDDPDRRVAVERDGDVLRIRLDRLDRRNAVDAAMRDALLEALAVAEADPTLRVVVGAAGPSFSAGGDLDEFGTATDPATAHVLRLTAHVGEVLDRLRDRVTVEVHGACIGAGVELPSFAGRVVAAPDASFGLPEVPMGLIPGAGGTVGIPRRIGRWRTTWLALSGIRLDAGTALRWGLVDEVRPVG